MGQRHKKETGTVQLLGLYLPQKAEVSPPSLLSSPFIWAYTLLALVSNFWHHREDTLTCSLCQGDGYMWRPAGEFAGNTFISTLVSEDNLSPELKEKILFTEDVWLLTLAGRLNRGRCQKWELLSNLQHPEQLL